MSIENPIPMGTGDRPRSALTLDRGMWMWNLPQCEGGDLLAIIARCQRANITTLFIKAGNAGDPWSQFTEDLVEQLHAAGIKVFGWSYDVPGKAQAQADVVRRVAGCGADGFAIDAEIEWDRCPTADVEARRYIEAIRAATPAGFVLADAPWDVVRFHGGFPFAAFGAGVDLRSPQAYHVAHGISMESTLVRYDASWRAHEMNNPARPHLPSLSLWKPKTGAACTAADVAFAETWLRQNGYAGWMGWEWSKTLPEVWQYLETRLG